MKNGSIKRILIDKGVTHLFHSNTVATACTFLENGGLLSRGAVKDLGLYQTSQTTDTSDVEFDVFYDIFFDSVDIHQCSKNINYYGPVLFVYSIDVLDMLPPNCIRITKDNPIYWNSKMSDKDKYFLTDSELQLHYQLGNFRQHLTLRHQTKPLPFDYLEEIIIDNPEIEDTSYFNNAVQHLQNLLDVNNLDIPLHIRRCLPNCNCKKIYRNSRKSAIYHKFHF